MNIQSALFSHFDPTDEKNKPFVKHLKALLKLNKDQRLECLGGFPAVRLAETESEERAALEKISENTGLPHYEVSKIQSIFQHFLKFLVAIIDDEEYEDDTPEKWTADLAACGVLTESEKQPFLESIAYLRDEIMPLVEPDIRKRAFSAGAFPSFMKFYSTVELRAVQRQEYDWTKEPGDYIPQIIDVVPMASIHIGTDKGEPRDIFFQATSSDIDKLIAGLQTLKLDLEALVKFSIGLDEQAK